MKPIKRMTQSRFLKNRWNWMMTPSKAVAIRDSGRRQIFKSKSGTYFWRIYKRDKFTHLGFPIRDMRRRL